jgi:DNA-binding transcriptional ArsR family regulator
VDQVEELAEVFKALSDPTRLRLVRLLGKHRGSLCVNALASRLGVTQSAVSQHLRVLRQARLVSGLRQGYHVHYSVNTERLDRFKEQMREMLGDEFVVLE